MNKMAEFLANANASKPKQRHRRSANSKGGRQWLAQSKNITDIHKNVIPHSNSTIGRIVDSDGLANFVPLHKRDIQQTDEGGEGKNTAG